jgi:hypothetical protein
VSNRGRALINPRNKYIQSPSVSAEDFVVIILRQSCLEGQGSHAITLYLLLVDKAERYCFSRQQASKCDEVLEMY